MASCPRCRMPLVKRVTSNGVVYGCRACGGRAAALAVLRRAGAKPAFLRQLWLGGRRPQAVRLLACPHCNRRMAEVEGQVNGHTLTVDICGACASVWFDAKEFEVVPKLPRAQEKPMSAKGRREFALFKVQRMQQQEELGGVTEEAPSQAWQWIPGLFGLPVEYQSPSLSTLPWLTWSIAVLTVAVFIATASHLTEVVTEWGFIPAELTRQGGLTIVTSFFLHAGIFHLVANMYFFLIFGDNVEDNLGRLSFVMLLVAAHTGGIVLHGLFDPRPGVPLVGASAGISGILAYYAVMFPRAKVGFLFAWGYWLRYFLRWITMPAFVVLVLFLAVQLIGMFAQVSGFGGVSYLGHLGGLAVGIGVAIAVRLARRRAVKVALREAQSV